MIISANKMQTLKSAPNSAYEVILPEYLYQSNKIEGSTFTLGQIDTFYATNKVTGDHDLTTSLRPRIPSRCSIEWSTRSGSN